MRGKDMVSPSVSSASSSLLKSASPISGSTKSSGSLVVMAVVAAALAFIIDIKILLCVRAVLSGCPVDSRPLPGRHGQNTVTDTFQFTGAVITLHILAVASHGVG